MPKNGVFCLISFVTDPTLVNTAFTFYLHNFFQPVMRVAENKAISEPGQTTRVHRRYDQVQTPFDRLCATETLSPEQRAQLTALRDQTNPRQLLGRIRAQRAHIFSLPHAQPEEDQIVYGTLTQIPDPRLEHARAQ